MRLVRSSRLRIALSTAFVGTLVLGAFASAVWWKLKDLRVAAMDREMESVGTNLALNSRRGMTLTTATTRLRELFGKEREKGWQVAVSGPGEKAERSARWPADIDPAAFPHSADIIPYEVNNRERRFFPDMEDGPWPRGGGERRRPWERRPPFREKDPDRPPVPEDAENRRPERERDNGPVGPPVGPRLYRSTYSNVEAEGKTWRLGVYGHAGTGTTIHLLLDPDVFAPDLATTRQAFLLALPGALLLVGLGGWLAARRSLLPVEGLSASMEALSLKHPNARLDASGADTEFQRIINAYNVMLDRFERSYLQATRFSADASHELKTPLAVMRATVEQRLSRCVDSSEEQRAHAGMLDELDNLQAIIESLLLLSRADAGVLATSRESLDLSTWLLPLLEDASLMAESRRVTVLSEVAPDIRILADPVLLARAIHNLLRNAVAYNFEGGEIRCRLHAGTGNAILTISNTGPPIPAEERGRIFDRFVRGTATGGTGEGRGLGIGLSLAREIFQAHGGDLRLTTEAGKLTIFTGLLPLESKTVA